MAGIKFDEYDDDASAEALELKKRIAAGGDEPEREEGEPLELPVDDEEDEAEEPEESQPQLSRKQKKQNRYRQINDENAALQRRIGEMEQRQAFLAGYLQNQASGQRQEQGDELDVRIQETYAEHQKLVEEVNRAAKTMTPEEMAREKTAWFRRLQGIEEQRARLIAAKVQRDSGADPRSQAIAVRNQLIAQENADIISDPKKQGWAQGRWAQLVQGEGKPDSYETLQQVFQETRERFGMAKTKASPTARRATTGISRGGGGPAASGENTIRMTPSMQKLARAAYPNHAPEQAYKAWAKNEGRRFLALNKGER